MPRVKIVDFDEASGSANPRVPARGRVSREPALNPDFEERMKVFMKKECHPERGIEVSELGNTTIPAVVRARNWEDFVLNPPPYNERIVREFYAGMIVQAYYKGSAVMVRGKPVKIQATDINRYHKTTLENPIPIGVEHQTLFIRQNVRFANSLVVEPMHQFCKEAGVDMSEPRDATAFYLTIGMMDAGTWKGIHKKKKGQEATVENSGPGRKKRRAAVEEDADHGYSEAALQDDEDAAGGFEEDIPGDDGNQIPVDRILAAVNANQAAIQEVGRGLHKRLDQMNEDWGFDMTELRRELGLSVYARRRRYPTVGGPVIDEGGAMRRAMELSRKEAEDRAAAEKEPKGKRVA
ncbi:hypothetical protein LWI29_002499 [Acer saccharum]|uniref:Uncharacterized protein n=1 Tax=Acer saccharum TaxID=4024 RepID=A0AA39STE2_ACESA|nr:hypothetical protein LWI29_002499 [Acer saccharum]